MNKQKEINKNDKYFSQAWEVNVRPSIAREFTYDNKFFDDNLAGLHEIRARLAEKNYKKKLLIKQHSFCLQN